MALFSGKFLFGVFSAVVGLNGCQCGLYRRLSCVALFLFGELMLALPSAADEYSVEYRFRFLPETGSIGVSLTLNNASLVKSLDFNLRRSQCSDFKSADNLVRKGDRLHWSPGSGQANLRYICRVNHSRKTNKGKTSFDAYMTRNWAVFRGDDIVPPARVVTRRGAQSSATLVFDYKDGWTSVNTGWPLQKSASKKLRAGPVFEIIDPDRKFDRPTGWMIAGNIGTRRSYLGREDNDLQQLAVSAPQDSSMRRMDILTFVQFAWPEYKKAFGKVPDKFLIVGANDPMWRGGLSAANSLFMHADRPIVSENGTSSLLHELVHLVTHVSGKKNADWIAEGLAEFYAIELLQRAGGINQQRRSVIFSKLGERAKNVKKLHMRASTGKVTAAAVIVFNDLDNEIRTATKGKQSLDTVVQLLMKKGKVDLSDLRQAFTAVVAKPSAVLGRPLVTKL